MTTKRCQLMVALVACGILALGTSIVSAETTTWGAILNTLYLGPAAVPTSTLDLQSCTVIVKGSPYSTLWQYTQYANDAFAYDRPGITSSTAKNDPLIAIYGIGAHTVGTMSGADYNMLNGAPFFGQTVQDSWVLSRFTYYGDVNLDGVFDPMDYGIVDSLWGIQAGGDPLPTSGWGGADFDYNGALDPTDYGIMDAVWGMPRSGAAGSAGLTVASGAAVVPEPSSLALLFAGAFGALLYWTRKR